MTHQHGSSKQEFTKLIKVLMTQDTASAESKFSKAQMIDAKEVVFYGVQV